VIWRVEDIDLTQAETLLHAVARDFLQTGCIEFWCQANGMSKKDHSYHPIQNRRVAALEGCKPMPDS